MNQPATETEFNQPMFEAVRNSRVDAIAAHVAKIRKDQGFTQTVDGLGHCQEQLNPFSSRKERGDLRIHADTLLQLAKKLKVTPQSIVCGIATKREPRRSTLPKITLPCDSYGDFGAFRI